MVAEGKTASRHLEMSKEICLQSFLSFHVFHVFAKNTCLLIPSSSPPFDLSFKSLKIFAYVFSTINCVEINFVIVIFKTIVWKIFLHTIIYIFRSRIICYSYTFKRFNIMKRDKINQYFLSL